MINNGRQDVLQKVTDLQVLGRVEEAKYRLKGIENLYGPDTLVGRVETALYEKGLLPEMVKSVEARGCVGTWGDLVSEGYIKFPKGFPLNRSFCVKGEGWILQWDMYKGWRLEDIREGEESSQESAGPLTLSVISLGAFNFWMSHGKIPENWYEIMFELD